ncbi:MAG: YigZ family protein [Candidatus Peribacteria bacterium]|nr:MAG: YigZ family protein [Candidatus Peribacteria bacterium]
MVVPDYAYKSLAKVITDRKSVYTVSGGCVHSKSEVEQFMKSLLAQKEFRKATHNSYAYRLVIDDGGILEGKQDDGETGAGNCILRELQRAYMANCIVVVTRYYGGIQLHADRFKHVIQATRILLQQADA